MALQVTITDFAHQKDKETLLLVAGEHPQARLPLQQHGVPAGADCCCPQELIGAEILLWLGHLFTAPDVIADWAAFQPVQASAWKAGWTKTTLAEWALSLLKLVEFRVRLCRHRVPAVCPYIFTDACSPADHTCCQHPREADGGGWLSVSTLDRNRWQSRLRWSLAALT